MDKDEEKFLKELLNDFRIEAAEHYEAIINGILVLEKKEESQKHKAVIENVFREIHSLKGASRAVNLPEIEKLCQNLESLFNSLKKGEAVLFPPMIDVLYQACDLLKLLLTDIDQPEKKSSARNLTPIIKKLEFVHQSALANVKNNSAESENSVNLKDAAVELHDPIIESVPDNAFVSNSPVPEVIKDEQVKVQTSEKLVDKETVRISTAKLNNILRQSEELIAIKSTFDYFAKELQSISNQSANEIQKNLHTSLTKLSKQFDQFNHVTSRMIDELLIDIKTTLLYPFSSLLSIVPKIVRDLSKEFSKEIDILIKGDQIEIDRRILEEIKDPLIHLLRNCIDHGIESKQDRLKTGKPVKGTIRIEIAQEIDKKVELRISDDGAGLDKSKIINSALKSGIIKSNEIDRLSEKEIYGLIFSSGVSTSQFITDISGRGLGMAIVAEKVEKLGGNIDIETEAGKGTSFRILLPQTIATFRGILVKASDQQYIIPSYAVERALRVFIEDIKSVESRKTICLNNEIIALVTLSDLLKIGVNKPKKVVKNHLHVLILSASQKKVALAIDEMLGEHEGMVKDLGLQLKHVKNIAGATLLGSGKVIPILNVAELMETASNTVSTIDFASKADPMEVAGQKNVLVVEDSITIRSMLRNFIENAGFSVKTAVDGLEGYNMVQNENFDVVVSDIEMPRMNGFELTSKIRENKNYSDMPIILVTALESADDRQRGLESGANAYIVKSSFEKSNLIETIQRLI